MLGDVRVQPRSVFFCENIPSQFFHRLRDSFTGCERTAHQCPGHLICSEGRAVDEFGHKKWKRTEEWRNDLGNFLIKFIPIKFPKRGS
ncbi:hypothetical protein B9G54_03170 [Alloscardovia macacae]|uniref:Uncharacterized protein n=1 Tax=Alloscardovia macacae TaxID=1160091 RepID=A0A1Y2T1X0_9BIFI|nr:hypothetical protein B9G54_03170 [Alloscardovia macacae]OTA29175.1 hypothetical protein B9T39_04675 [Alloscardovia macacae]